MYKVRPPLVPSLPWGPVGPVVPVTPVTPVAPKVLGALMIELKEIVEAEKACVIIEE